MASIHGNEQAAGEQGMEFAYDVINTGKTNPKVAAILDRVRMIVMPVVNVDGWVRFRRANCGGAVVAPNTCNATGVDMNRNYPFGWGSNVNGSSTFANRGAGPGSEPEVQNTMDIVKNNQVVALITMHTNSHAFFYPGLEIAAGLPADLDVIRGLSRRDGQRHQQRLHECPRLGARLRDERRDDRLVLLRHARFLGDVRRPSAGPARPRPTIRTAPRSRRPTRAAPRRTTRARRTRRPPRP